MTPKEKADDLINKFADENYFSEQDILEDAKHNALICVDEIILNGFNPRLPFMYWEKVKEEINKL